MIIRIDVAPAATSMCEPIVPLLGGDMRRESSRFNRRRNICLHRCAIRQLGTHAMEDLAFITLATHPDGTARALERIFLRRFKPGANRRVGLSHADLDTEQACVPLKRCRPPKHIRNGLKPTRAGTKPWWPTTEDVHRDAALQAIELRISERTQLCQHYVQLGYVKSINQIADLAPFVRSPICLRN